MDIIVTGLPRVGHDWATFTFTFQSIFLVSLKEMTPCVSIQVWKLIMAVMNTLSNTNKLVSVSHSVMSNSFVTPWTVDCSSVHRGGVWVFELMLIPSPGLSEVWSVFFFLKTPTAQYGYVFVALYSPYLLVNPLWIELTKSKNHILFVCLFAYAFIFLTLDTT